MTGAVYTVACGTCSWEHTCATPDEADAAAERHERENDGHMAYVHRPDMTEEAA